MTAGRAGPVGALDLALVQAAVHDAVQSIEGRFEPYKVTIDGAAGSPSAAAAAAAHGLLVWLCPSQAAALDSAFGDYLAINGLAGDPGIAVGQDVAVAMRAYYRPTPSPQPTFTGGTVPGEWRPTPNFIGSPPPPPATTMTTPWLADVRPFTLRRPSQHRPEPPPPMTSRRYARDYDEVSDISDCARLFALANLSMADGAITAWDSKRHYNFWRPVTAIREGDTDGNHRTTGCSAACCARLTDPSLGRSASPRRLRDRSDPRHATRAPDRDLR